MKNKEIEELLNKIRNSIKTHKKLNLDDDMLVVLEFDVIQWNLLLSYIEQLEKRNKELYEGFMATQEELTYYATKNEQLEKKIDHYENPEDLTLFYMWLDTNAKDKIKKLQQENHQLKKQKDDVVEYIKTTTYSDITGLEQHNITEFWFIKDLLRMLGDKDVQD